MDHEACYPLLLPSRKDASCQQNAAFIVTNSGVNEGSGESYLRVCTKASDTWCVGVVRHAFASFYSAN